MFAVDVLGDEGGGGAGRGGDFVESSGLESTSGAAIETGGDKEVYDNCLIIWTYFLHNLCRNRAHWTLKFKISLIDF